MKSFVFPWMLVLCTACTMAPSLSTDASSPSEATLPSTANAEPPAGAIPSPTTIPPPTLSAPTPSLEIVIDNIVIGPQDHLYVSGFGSSGDDLRHFAQWDGARWIELGGFRTAGSSMAVDAAGRLYTEVLTDSSQGSSTAIMRWRGDKWEDITGDFSVVVDALQPGRVSSNVPVRALELDEEGNLYAGGSFYYLIPDQSAELPMGYVATWNGEAWAVLGEGFDKVNIFALELAAPGAAYASGEQPLTPEGESGFIATWHASEWTQIEPGRPDIILMMALDPSGGLYVAGQAGTGGAFVDYWDGTHWTTIASQFEGEASAVFALAVDLNGRLCVGGEFQSVNGIPASNIACWDGNAWHALGNGTNERVFGLAFDTSASLYAVGYFTEVGDLPVDHLARWDGQRWHALSP